MAQPESSADRDRLGSDSALDREAAEALARTLKVVADPTRLQILSFVFGSANGECIVRDLADFLELRQPTVSHHLRVMTEEGLLVRRQVGRNAWFSIAPDRLMSIADLLR